MVDRSDGTNRIRVDGELKNKMTYETINYAVSDGVAKIVFNRPEAGNSINRKFADEFMEVAIGATTDPSLRCIVIAAAGPMYSFGGDLKFFRLRWIK